MVNFKRVSKLIPNVARTPELARCVRDYRDWRAMAAGYLGFGSPSYPFEIHTRDGEAMTIERFEDLATAWLVFIRRDYPVSRSSRIILDAGANIGAFTLYAARSAPEARVVALEPFPATFERLAAHVSASRVAGRISCRPWALGRADGHRRMDATPMMASQFRSLLENGSSQPGIEVETVTLETLCERERIDRIDLLKMDIEGSEYELIESTPGDVLRRIAAVALEYHPNGSKPDLFRKLRDAGFELVHDHPAPLGYGVAHFRLGRSGVGAG
jgi:FkbM family methyltransferase